MNSTATAGAANRETRHLGLAGAVAGLLAAAVALAFAELVAVLVGPGASPVVAVGGTVIDAAPEWLKSFAIRTFGTADKPILIGTILAALAAGAAVAGVVSVRRRALGIAAIVLVGAIGAVAAVNRPNASPAYALPSIVGAMLGLVTLLVILRTMRGESAAEPDLAFPPAAKRPVGERLRNYLAATDRKGAAFDRRAFLGTSLAAAAVAAASGGGARLFLAQRADVSASRSAVRLPAPASPAVAVPAGADLPIPGLTKFQTPNDDFYRVDTALLVPQVSAEDWKLRIHGMVDREIEIDFAALLRRDLIERDITLTCVSNEVGGPYAGNARWLGAPLADLLREAGVHPGADQILSRSVDGMTIGTPTAVVMDGRDALLAVGMNGKPLPATHGFPVRMVVPGLYGYVSATKWLVDLELTTFARAQAYWVKRGWAPRAPIKTMSRIDIPRPLQQVPAGKVAVAGVAWAQHRGVKAVEVRVDEGAWQPARLAEVPTIDTWRQWVFDWDAPAGRHTLEVRATDRSGKAQRAERAAPFPSGATGWHSTAVTVV